MHPKVIIIGIDGGTFAIIDPLIQDGRLPNIGRLLSGGVRAELLSTRPPLTPVAWGTFQTGCGPGKHGTFGFVRVRPDDYVVEFLNGSYLRAPSLWQIAGRHGVRCGVHNVPWTYPPAAINGYMVSGLDAPAFGPDIAYPRGLFERICDGIGGYFEKFVPPAAVAQDVRRLEDQVAGTGDVARWLLGNEPADLFMTVFGSTDHVQHNFWNARRQSGRGGTVEDIIQHTYELVDRQVGRLLDGCAGPETYVIVASDHGAGPCRGGFNLDRWLAERGWLTFRSTRPRPTETLLRSATDLARRLAPRGLRTRLQRHARGAREHLATARMTRRIDWQHTRAYCWSDYGNLQLNVSGRQGQGVVGAGEAYEAARAELAAALIKLKHPENGGPVVGAVRKSEEIYGGPYVGEAPDLLVETSGYEYEIITNLTQGGPVDPGLDGLVFPPSVRSGTHRREGVLIVSGPGIRPGVLRREVSIADVAPTVLHLMGLPVPTYMDGAVVEEMLDPEHPRHGPPSYEDVPFPSQGATAGYSDDEAEQIEKHLQDLGYV